MPRVTWPTATMTTSLESAYRECLQLTRSHYENFPVASILVPEPLRKPISAIYAFARRADDIADESGQSVEMKLAELDRMENNLRATLSGSEPSEPLYLALKDTVESRKLKAGYFYDLLDAFRQDVTKKRYADFNEILDYCRRSANPVGRLLLQLTRNDSEQNNRDSDLVCSSLQIINFLQDIEQDARENNRIYLPQDEMQDAGVTDDDILQRSTRPEVVAFVHMQIARVRRMMEQGAPLGRRLDGRFGIEIRAIVAGGLCICNALERQGDNIYSRPRLAMGDKLAMLATALFRL